MTQDRLFATPREHIVDFAFDASVAAVFPDMIRRSVPGYAEVIALTGLIAAQYAQPDSRIYDLGCSLGASTLAMRRRVCAAGVRMVAVDNSEAMVARCREHLAADASAVAVDLVCSDLREVPVEDASVVVLNFTLQFVPVEQRLPLLQRLCAGMRPGGVLVLSEKMVFADAAEQTIQEGMQLAFKRANGYSDLEISQKRSALEQVLHPETLEAHQARLAAAGFARSAMWFRCFNFASLVAFR